MVPSQIAPSEFDVVSSEAFRSMMLYWYPHGAEGPPAPHPIFRGRVKSVHLYDSIAFIERGVVQARLTHLKRGRRAGSFADHATPFALKQSHEYRRAAHELRRAVLQHAAPLPTAGRQGGKSTPAVLYSTSRTTERL
jgi:hypothetical protein